MRNARTLISLSCLTLTLAAPDTAPAYSGNSEVSEPCHETITLDALARLRSEQQLAPPIEPQGADDKALVNDLPINVDTDLVGATLVLANRDADLKGNEPDDLDQLAPVHGAPENQKEHCLRAPNQDEPNGSEMALADCRGHIRALVERALAGLDENGNVDPNRRTTFKAVLDIRGPVEVPLPTFYVEMGRALHAFQDAFSHTWRTADHLRVTTVLNYAEVVNDTYDENRDGPPHSSMLDECKNLDSFRLTRLQTARNASIELMSAALRSAMDDDERMANVDRVLDKYLSLEEGCTPANDWCDAPENEYRDAEGCTCSLAGVGGTWGFWPLALGAALLLARRRRSRRRARQLAKLTALGGVLLCAEPAFAQDDEEVPPLPPTSDETLPPVEPASPDSAPPTTTADDDDTLNQNLQGGAVANASSQAVCPTGDTAVDVSPDSHHRSEPFPLGGQIAVGGALSNAAIAASLGLRYRLSENFLVGLDGEYNPWFSRTTKEFRTGTTNVYGTLVVRFPMDFERVNIRSTLQLGISRMNFDLFGVPKGTIGPYVGFNLIGLDFELARSLYLVLDPAHIAIPIPQTDGVPFSYPQYRITLGLQFGA